jgi:phenylpropionate dioxygenase-like ring-hydroxylating dioxygenase large terminal subunit
MEAGTLELGEKAGSSLVSSYFELGEFRQEMAKVIHRRPIPFVPKAQIQNPGDFFAQELCGVPLVAVRDERGQAKVFLNVCRHRGAKLVPESTGHNCTNFVCPFHGWSYKLDGTIAEIPDRKNCFSATAESAFRLKEFRSYDCAGMIWVVLDSSGVPDGISGNFTQLEADFPELGLTPTLPLPERSFIGAFNWKIAVEAFLEVYHFPHAHAPYLSELQFPNLSLADSSGENYRIVVPLSKPDGQQPTLEWAQVMYFIFPSTFLLFYSDHVALIALTPISVDQTKFRYVPLVPSKEGLTSQEVKQKVDFLEVIIAQDVAILEGIQSGLVANANSRFTFTRLEHVLGAFHKNLGAEVSKATEM